MDDDEFEKLIKEAVEMTERLAVKELKYRDKDFKWFDISTIEYIHDKEGPAGMFTVQDFFLQFNGASLSSLGFQIYPKEKFKEYNMVPLSLWVYDPRNQDEKRQLPISTSPVIDAEYEVTPQNFWIMFDYTCAVTNVMMFEYGVHINRRSLTELNKDYLLTPLKNKTTDDGITMITFDYDIWTSDDYTSPKEISDQLN